MVLILAVRSFFFIGKTNERTRTNPLHHLLRRAISEWVSAGLPRRVLDATMSQNSEYLAWQHTQHKVIKSTKG